LPAVQRSAIQSGLSQGKLQTSSSQQHTMISKSNTPQKTYQPAPGSWAAMAQSRATAGVTEPLPLSSALLNEQTKHSSDNMA
jgi:hypothetical protein